MSSKWVVLAALTTLGTTATLAADLEYRQTVSINTPNPTIEQVDAALFPKGIADLKAECAQMEQIGLRCQSVISKSSMDTIQVTFARGSAVLTEEGKAFLRTLGAALKRKPDVWKSVAIEGHTDATGTDATNRKLSKSRADSVKSFLQAEFGLSKIETIGRSSDKLRDLDDPSSAMNRRVEFIPEW